MDRPRSDGRASARRRRLPASRSPGLGWGSLIQSLSPDGRLSTSCPTARGAGARLDARVSSDAELAQAYTAAVAAADASAVEAEPEAQLTVPVANLLEGLAVGHGLGSLRLLREAQMPGVRPDFVVLLADRPCGWVELKAPGHSLDGHLWVGREKKQWALLAELDALLVCNGEQAALYRSGQLVNSPAPLPYGSPAGWDAAPLVDLMRLLTLSRPAVVTRTAQLAAKLAPLTRMLRERISTGLTPATPVAAISQAKTAWSQHIHEDATDEEFADDLAQVIAYSLAIAALRGGADINGDHLITLAEARQVLQTSNEVLAATLGPVLTIGGLGAALAAEIGAIERLVSAVDSTKIASSTDSRGEPWLWFYEDFLATYDPERRKQSGVYYTPTGVVDLQVRLVDQILRERFGRKLSYGDKTVVTLDPATGSGTYPLAVLDRAGAVAEAVRGHAGPAQVAPTLAQNVIAFELLPGPYAVAHLRIGQRLAELAGQLVPPGAVRVYLTDTLDDPDSGPPQLGLWGDVAVLAAERERAAQVKSTQPVTVVLGNPPYRRRTAQSGGGWVVHPAAGRALFDDVTEPPRTAGVIFSAQASLFNDYVYFWRWAIHKAFEQTPDTPAVVSFITASSWLQGPAFLGLRTLARELADEVWVVDLGGEGRGGQLDDNVFAIQTPVAVVTLFRRATSTPTPATVHYRRVTGTRHAKLTALAEIHAPQTEPANPPPTGDPADGWAVLPAAVGDRMVPISGGLDWQAMPALTDLFPWQQPGCKIGRTWPIAPTAELLRERWRAMLSRTDAAARAEAHVTPSSGRTIFTRVAGLKPIAELPADAPPRPIVRYGFRSFDRQWTPQDPRVAALERPALWAALSDHQIFLTTLTTSPLGRGPALTATTLVPDLHHFRGSFGGKDVIPLYRDATTTKPNVTAGLCSCSLSGTEGTRSRQKTSPPTCSRSWPTPATKVGSLSSSLPPDPVSRSPLIRTCSSRGETSAVSCSGCRPTPTATAPPPAAGRIYRHRPGSGGRPRSTGSPARTETSGTTRRPSPCTSAAEPSLASPQRSGPTRSAVSLCSPVGSLPGPPVARVVPPAARPRWTGSGHRPGPTSGTTNCSTWSASSPRPSRCNHDRTTFSHGSSTPRCSTPTRSRPRPPPSGRYRPDRPQPKLDRNLVDPQVLALKTVIRAALGRLTRQVAGAVRVGLPVQPRDVVLEPGPFDAPLAAAADLHRGQRPIADERVDLTARDAELLGDPVQGKETGPGRRRDGWGVRGVHGRTVDGPASLPTGRVHTRPPGPPFGGRRPQTQPDRAARVWPGVSATAVGGRPASRGHRDPSPGPVSGPRETQTTPSPSTRSQTQRTRYSSVCSAPTVSAVQNGNRSSSRSVNEGRSIAGSRGLPPRSAAGAVPGRAGRGWPVRARRSRPRSGA